jgi:hypothetical protein
MSRWLHNTNAVRAWAIQVSPSYIPVKWWQAEQQRHPRHANGTGGILQSATHCIDDDLFSAVTREMDYHTVRTTHSVFQYDQPADKAIYRLAHSSRSWPWILASLAAEAIVLLGLALASLTVVSGPWYYNKLDVLPLSYLTYGVLSSLSWYIPACPWGRRRLGRAPIRILNFMSVAWLAFICAIILKVSQLTASHKVLAPQDASADIAATQPSTMRFVCHHGCRLFPSYSVGWGGYLTSIDLITFAIYRDLTFQHTRYYYLVITGIGFLAPIVSVGVATWLHRKIQRVVGDDEVLGPRLRWVKMDIEWLM